jgi:hypothetical protein
VGSSTGNTFVDIIAPRAGLKKEDYQEVKMNVNEMVAAAGPPNPSTRSSASELEDVSGFL